MGLILTKTFVVAAWYPLKTHAQAPSVYVQGIYFVTTKFFVFHSVPFQNDRLAYVANNMANWLPSQGCTHNSV